MVAPNEDLSASAQGRTLPKESLKAYSTTVHPVSGKKLYLVFDSTKEKQVPDDVMLCLASFEMIKKLLGYDVGTTQETLPEFKDSNGVFWEFVNSELLTPAETLLYLDSRYSSATYFEFVKYYNQFALIVPRYDEFDLTGFTRFN